MNKTRQWPLVIGVLGSLSIVTFLGWGVWKATHPEPSPLVGYMDATTLSIQSKVPGRLEYLHVRLGDTVRAGQVVATLALPELEAKYRSVEAQVDAARAKEALVQEGARKEEITAAEADVGRARAGFDYASETLKRMQTLYDEGLIPAQTFDEVKAKTENARGMLTAAQAKLNALKTGARTEEKKAVEALLHQAKEGAREVQILLNQGEVTSPIGGVVSQLILNQGEVVPPGFPILRVTDLLDPWVTLYLPETLLSHFLPEHEFKGKVPALNTTLTFKVTVVSPLPSYAAIKSTRQNTGVDLKTFEVRAVPTTIPEGLRPGMTVIVEAP